MNRFAGDCRQHGWGVLPCPALACKPNRQRRGLETITRCGKAALVPHHQDWTRFATHVTGLPCCLRAHGLDVRPDTDWHRRFLGKTKKAWQNRKIVPAAEPQDVAREGVSSPRYPSQHPTAPSDGQ